VATILNHPRTCLATRHHQSRQYCSQRRPEASPYRSGPGSPSGFENVSTTIEIDPHCVIKSLFAFATDHRREMKDGDFWRIAYRTEHGLAVTDITGVLGYSEIGGLSFGWLARESVEQNNMLDGLLLAGRPCQRSALYQLIAQERPEKSPATSNNNFHKYPPDVIVVTKVLDRSI